MMKARLKYPHMRGGLVGQLREGFNVPRHSYDFERMEIDLGWHPVGQGWIPVTPAGTMLLHLEADSEDEAWANLLEDASHMPYRGKEGFYERGYRVEQITL